MPDMRLATLCAVALLFAGAGSAQASADTPLVRGTVEAVIDERVEPILGTELESTVQLLRVRLDTGERVEVQNDLTPLGVGDGLYAFPVSKAGGTVYSVHDVDRRGVLALAVLLFAIVTIAVGRLVGVRALVSLAVSVVLILYVLIPLLGSGYPPVLVSAIGAALILAVATAITHGVGRHLVAAYGAALVAVFVAIVLGEMFVYAAHLSGFSDSSAATLSLAVGNINMQGLLLGALIIGVLGIVDDLAVTQVVTVSELRRSGVSSTKELYERAMRIGREHLGAVVNTLVLAYAGASLPLLILFTYAPAPIGLLINSEVIAVEIIRAAVGGVALAVVIPVATYLGILSQSTTPTGAHGHGTH